MGLATLLLSLVLGAGVGQPTTSDVWRALHGDEYHSMLLYETKDHGEQKWVFRVVSGRVHLIVDVLLDDGVCHIQYCDFDNNEHRESVAGVGTDRFAKNLYQAVKKPVEDYRVRIGD